MERPDPEIYHQWHVAINKAHEGQPHPWRHWMYLAKSAANEVPRLAYWFKREREGTMPVRYRQCSHSPIEAITDNHLTCCLGQACRTCPHLLALESTEVPPEQFDTIKAWTCVTHILTECGAHPNQYDTSEGFVMTTEDQMYWDRVYSILAAADREGI